jgi:C4-dicarboxylate transporter
MLVSLGVSRPAAAAMVALTGFMDLGPAVGTANLAAKIAGMPAATYFVQYQLPVAVWVIAVVAVLTEIAFCETGSVNILLKPEGYTCQLYGGLRCAMEARAE